MGPEEGLLASGFHGYGQGDVPCEEEQDHGCSAKGTHR